MTGHQIDGLKWFITKSGNVEWRWSKVPYSWPNGTIPPTGQEFPYCPVREKRCRPAKRTRSRKDSELGPLLAFWDKLDEQTQLEFEKQAMDRADLNKRRWHDDARSCGRDTANYFHMAILNDYFRRRDAEISKSDA